MRTQKPSTLRGRPPAQDRSLWKTTPEYQNLTHTQGLGVIAANQLQKPMTLTLYKIDRNPTDKTPEEAEEFKRTDAQFFIRGDAEAVYAAASRSLGCRWFVVYEFDLEGKVRTSH